MFNPLMMPPGCGRFAAYARAHEEGPVHLQAPFPVANVIGYDACMQVLRDAETFSNSPFNSFLVQSKKLTDEQKVARLRPMLGQTADFVADLLLMNDPPTHTRLRALVSRAFAPAAMKRLTDQVRKVADELLDAVVAKGSFDLVEDLAIPLPMHIVAEILGVDTDRRADFKRWSDGFVSVPAQSALAGLSMVEDDNWRQEFVDYFTEIFARRRKEPRQDLVSQLLTLEAEGEKISPGELMATCVLLIVAGNETSTNMISNTLLALTQNPEEYDYLFARPQLVPNAIEEGLRYYAPIQGFPRYAAKESVLCGKRISKGTMVMVWAGAANRDESVFADPERFEITRAPNKHLSFGLGIHHCLGAGLARVEGQIAFERLFQRLGQVRPVPGSEPEFVPSAFLFGLKRFEMEFDEKTARAAV